MIRIAVLVIALALVASQALFTVFQTEQALVLRFGEYRRTVSRPGLAVKVPFIENHEILPANTLDLDVPAEEVIAADQKRIVVDTFVRFRIVDPLRYYQAVRNESRLRGRLGDLVSASLRRVVGSVTLVDLLSGQRGRILADVGGEVGGEAQKLGISIIDVRIRRADLPEANSQAIFARMNSEREREAREFRAQGAEQAQTIRAEAERDRTVLLATAQRQAQRLRGEGEGESVKIYADAFGRDPEFFAFYRSMQAYREALSKDDTTLVLSPEGEFFRYFDSLGKAAR